MKIVLILLACVLCMSHAVPSMDLKDLKLSDGREESLEEITLESVERRVNALEYRENDLEDRVKDLEDPVKDLEDPVKDLEDRVKDLEDPVKDLEDPVKDLEDPVKDLEDRVKDLEQLEDGVNHVVKVELHDSTEPKVEAEKEEAKFVGGWSQCHSRPDMRFDPDDEMICSKTRIKIMPNKGVQQQHKKCDCIDAVDFKCPGDTADKYGFECSEIIKEAKCDHHLVAEWCCATCKGHSLNIVDFGAKIDELNEKKNKDVQTVDYPNAGVQNVKRDVRGPWPYRSAIQAALCGYDIVRGDPLPISPTGNSDPGMRAGIFDWMPSDPSEINKLGVQVAVKPMCSRNEKSTMITTMSQMNEVRGSTYEVGASVSGSGFGVSASMEFSASGSRKAMQDTLVKEEGAISIKKRECRVLEATVHKPSQGMPKFTDGFRSFIQETLIKATSKEEQLNAFADLITLYGTHYISFVRLGSRITVSSRFSKKARETKKESDLENCANMKAEASYLTVTAKVNAGGCGSKSTKDWQSDSSILTNTVVTSYGTFRTDEGTTLTPDDVKEPLPIYYKLAPLIDLFTQKAMLDGGVPNAKAASEKILGWLKPMFRHLSKYYCETVGIDIENCGAPTVHGCGYDDKCALNEQCLQGANGKTECVHKCNWQKVDAVAGTYINVPNKDEVQCTQACRKMSEESDSKVNGVRFRNGKCQCVEGLIQATVASRRTRKTTKTCVFKEAKGPYTCSWFYADGKSQLEVLVGSMNAKQCVKRCVEESLEDPNINGVTMAKSGSGRCFCERTMTGMTGNSYQTCYIVKAPMTCSFFAGDGVAAIQHRYKEVPNKVGSHCVRHCIGEKKKNKYINGVTIGTTNKECYCNEVMKGWKDNGESWKSCFLLPALKYTCMLRYGDGIGGKEKNVGAYIGEQCIKKCIEMKRTEDPTINGVTLKHDGDGCFCESGMTGFRGDWEYRTCFLRTDEEAGLTEDGDPIFMTE